MKAISTNGAPAPVAGAPYSQGIDTDQGMLFVSGQLPIEPDQGRPVAGGAAAQTRQAMSNVLAIVAAAGGTAQDIVKTTLYVVDLSQFGEINAAYAEALDGHRPARATVGVSELPLGAMIEIDAIAAIGG